MDIVFGVLVMFVVMYVVDAWGQERERRKRIKQAYKDAYKWQKPSIHGTRKFASRDELKKAGLL